MFPPNDSPSVMGVKTQIRSGCLNEQEARSVPPTGTVLRTTMEPDFLLLFMF